MIGALAACGLVDRAGAAVIVGDSSMSTDQLIAEYNSVMGALGQQDVPGTPVEINRAMLSSFIVSTLVSDLAAEAGVTASEAELKSVRDSLVAELGSEQALLEAAASGAVAPENIDRTLMTTLNYNALGRYLDPTGDETTQSEAASAAIMKYASEVGIEVAPRFGAWSAESLAIMGDNNDVSLTTDALAALLGQPTE
ncbi:MAG: hypothetical protein RIS75_709 [Actinomycetota bacterium]|jgi:hypothetical protein